MRSFLAGLGLGIGLGVLFAPKSGEQTRSDLQSRANELANTARETLERGRERIERGVSAMRGEIRPTGTEGATH